MIFSMHGDMLHYQLVRNCEHIYRGIRTGRLQCTPMQFSAECFGTPWREVQYPTRMQQFGSTSQRNGHRVL